MLLLQLLSLRMVINATNYEEAVDKSRHIPFFVLLFSPHCGHCKKVHPVWYELMDKYENDDKIIIAEVDCVESRKTCDKIFQATGWPTFVEFYKGKGSSVAATRTIEGFSEKTEEIKNRKIGLPCLAYPADVGKEIYPMFVYSVANATDTKVCNDMLTAFKYAPDLSGKVFYVPNGTRTEYWVKLNDHAIVNYTGRFILPSMIKWTQEWAMIPFGEWRVDIGMQIQRRFAFVVSRDLWQTYPFFQTAQRYLESVLVGRIDLAEFKEKQAIDVTAPALVLSSVQKDKFHIINNVTVEDFNQILKDYIAGAFENKMTVSLKWDVNSQQTASNKQVVPSPTIPIRIIEQKRVALFFSIGICCCVIVVFVVLCWKRRRPGKIE